MNESLKQGFLFQHAMKIAIVGYGNMGKTYAGSFIHSRFIKSDDILKSARYFTKYTNLKTILSLDGTKVYYLDGDREILIFDENEFLLRT